MSVGYRYISFEDAPTQFFHFEDARTKFFHDEDALTEEQWRADAPAVQIEN